MSIFDWQDYDQMKEMIRNKLLNKKITLDPLFIYYLFDDLSIKIIILKILLKTNLKIILKFLK